MNSNALSNAKSHSFSSGYTHAFSNDTFLYRCWQTPHRSACECVSCIILCWHFACTHSERHAQMLVSSGSASVSAEEAHTKHSAMVAQERSAACVQGALVPDPIEVQCTRSPAGCCAEAFFFNNLYDTRHCADTRDKPCTGLTQHLYGPTGST